MSYPLSDCRKKNSDVCGGLPYAGNIFERRLLYRNAKTALKVPENLRLVINFSLANLRAISLGESR